MVRRGILPYARACPIYCIVLDGGPDNHEVYHAEVKCYSSPVLTSKAIGLVAKWVFSLTDSDKTSEDAPRHITICTKCPPIRLRLIIAFRPVFFPRGEKDISLSGREALGNHGLATLSHGWIISIVRAACIRPCCVLYLIEIRSIYSDPFFPQELPLGVGL
ncbi:hypothetical protein Tco_1386596 [Tanacetum coccineum]